MMFSRGIGVPLGVYAEPGDAPELGEIGFMLPPLVERGKVNC